MRISDWSSDVCSSDLLFDTGVNMGPAVAVGFLQRALNALNRNGRDWADLAVDRSIGPATLGALRALLRVRGQAGACVLVRAMHALQGARSSALRGEIGRASGWENMCQSV